MALLVASAPASTAILATPAFRQLMPRIFASHTARIDINLHDYIDVLNVLKRRDVRENAFRPALQH